MAGGGEILFGDHLFFRGNVVALVITIRVKEGSLALDRASWGNQVNFIVKKPNHPFITPSSPRRQIMTGPLS